MLKTKRFSDLCVVIQVVFALISGVTQVLKLLESTEGIIQSWYMLSELFMALNLYLAFAAHRIKPSRVTAQMIMIYLIWVIISGANLAVMLRQGAQWNENDTRTVVLAGIGIGVTVILAYCLRMSMSDPFIKGWIAVFCLGLPQLILAFNMYCLGSAEGMSQISMWAGHVTVMTRLFQLHLSCGEDGTDRNRKASIFSELANFGSWIVVTLVYYLLLL